MARDFGTDQTMETLGILCVFQGFHCEELGQKIRQLPKSIMLALL
jgi:hypothetical protein